MNIIGALTGDESKLLRSITKTYRSAFPTVLLHPVFTTARMIANPTYVGT